MLAAGIVIGFLAPTPHAPARGPAMIEPGVEASADV